ncbi:MAG TPA: NAD(P)/FAD-dependent oxidoreductase, partial [Ktedonobacteraceae bacterium]|nr:NAD(P)/FAD-dependent oxidoreductase [Ktedonobacteraceae bacterium]
MKDVPETNSVDERLAAPQSVEPARPVAPAVKPRVVIVGAGFGGLQAARALRDAPVQVTVIDRNNHHLFQPLLYQVATAVLSPADICAPIRSVLRKQENAEVLLAEVTGVDVQAQRVLMYDESIPYDYLILATGARDSYFGHDDWAKFAPGLKSIPQARLIRSEILLAFEAAEREKDPEKRQALLTFVLVGAGPTGVEMAGAIGGLAHKTLPADFRHINPKDARIVLVEALPRILTAFPESLSNKAHEALNRLKVEVRTNSPVESIDDEGVVVAGERIPAKTIIWTAGVRASPAGEWLGAETDRAGRVKVGSDITLPGHPNIFVIGDTASASQDGKPLPGVAQVAIQQGHYVASMIADRVAGKEDTHAFHYVDKGNLAVIGRFYGIGQIGRWRFTGLLGWFVWLVVHLMFLVGYRNRVVVIFQWLVYFTTFQRGARLITFDEA